MNTAWRWIDRRALELLHDESVAEHGGLPGLRADNLLESALARPLNLAAYGNPDIADLAAAYGVGLAKNHAFVDGNKRIGVILTWTFLLNNGFELDHDEDEAYDFTIAVAQGTQSLEAITAWFVARRRASR